jgi:protein ImuB
MTAGRPARVLVAWCPQWLGPGEGPRERDFERVVSAVEQVCPRVEVLRPGVCAISARGPARYFGGEQIVAAKIIEAVGGLGFACQAGVADGLFAAELAAQLAVRQPDPVMIVPPGQTREFLAGHPVSAAGNAELAGLLPRLGIRTLGEFAALPAREAENRFGAQGVIAHRLARGLAPRPLAPRPPSAGLAVTAEFDPPQQRAEPVVFAAKALAEQLHTGLAARGLACVRIQVQVVCEDGRQLSRLWRHDGLLSALAVAERVRWQLAGWRDGQAGTTAGARETTGGAATGGSAAGDGIEPPGITLLRLAPDQLVRADGQQLGLWGDTVVSDRVARAAMRVQAMLGHAAVTRPVLAGGRSPGEQVTLVPFGDLQDPPRPAGLPWPGQIPAPAPATVYPDPLPAEVTDGTGAPVTVTGRALASAPPAALSAGGAPWLAVTAWAGPWPADERWWQPGHASRRARFQLVTEDGAGWLAAVRDGGWLIEARYD